MATFEVHGPFPISFEKRRGGRTLVFDDFWADYAEASYLAGERGCYVFGVSSGGGETPIYVGRATRTFKQETFNRSNRHKFHNGFSEYAKGTPSLYFVAHPSQRGRTNTKEIRQIEDFLIQAGIARNPALQNVQGAQRPTWSISGVIRSTRGRRSHSAVQFARLLDIG